jgi:hypothetical protein
MCLDSEGHDPGGNRRCPDLTDGEHDELRHLAGLRRTAHRLARRARIVLLAAEGLENKEIWAMLDVDPNKA